MVVVRSRTIGFVPCAKLIAVRLDHHPSGTLGLLRLRTRGTDALAALRSLHAQRFEPAHASFVARAPRLDAGADPHLFLRQPLVELFPTLRFRRQHGVLAFEVGVVVGAEVHQPAAIEFHDARRHATQERTIVRHEDQREAARGEVLFHPLDRFDVEMVRGLVEQNKVGLAHERAGQQRLTCAPARGLLDARFGVEPEMLEHRLHTDVQLPRIGRIEGAMQAVQFAQRRVGVIDAHANRSRVILREQAASIAQSLGYHLEHRPGQGQRHLLIEPRHRHAAQLHDSPAIGRLRTVEHLHERALAGPVPAQQTDPLSPLDGEIGVVEHGGTPEGDTDVLQRYERHAAH